MCRKEKVVEGFIYSKETFIIYFLLQFQFNQNCGHIVMPILGCCVCMHIQCKRANPQKGEFQHKRNLKINIPQIITHYEGLKHERLTNI